MVFANYGNFLALFNRADFSWYWSNNRTKRIASFSLVLDFDFIEEGAEENIMVWCFFFNGTSIFRNKR